jgi:integrase/recombinase XerD
MAAHHPDNERIKRKYFAYLKEAKRHSEPTVDAVAKALARFEEDTKYRDFRKFHFELAIAFKRRLTEQQNQRTGEKLSKATLHSTLGHLRAFFHWLAGQPGYKSRLQYSDSDYFNLSDKDMRVATARRDQVGPTLEQVRKVISLMPGRDDMERRNRALVAFTLLTGARDGAIASLKLKHLDLTQGAVNQDAREVNTKFSKSFKTYFFPVGEEVEQIVKDWARYLRQDLLWCNDDPLFPATRTVVGPSQKFEAVGLERAHWSSATPIRKVFKDAFSAAGLPYFNPHSLRNTLVRLGQDMCKTPEQFKAWSQNLGHEQVMTTFLSYGQVEGHRQGAIIRGLGAPQHDAPESVDALAAALVTAMRKSGVNLETK